MDEKLTAIVRVEDLLVKNRLQNTADEMGLKIDIINAPESEGAPVTLETGCGKVDCDAADDFLAMIKGIRCKLPPPPKPMPSDEIPTDPPISDMDIDEDDEE